MKRSRSGSLFIATTTAAILLSTFRFSASAVTTVFVYNSFGPGNTYSSTRWLVEGTNGPHGYQGHAESFVPNTSGNLNQVQVATIVEGGLPLSNFYLALDNGSGVPGTILESFANVPDAANGVVTFGSTVRVSGITFVSG